MRLMLSCVKTFDQFVSYERVEATAIRVGDKLPVFAAAEHDPLTGEAAYRWVSVRMPVGGPRFTEIFIDRNYAGHYNSYELAARFVLTIED